MRLPKPMELLKTVSSALKHSGAWQQASEHTVSATDEHGLVEVTFCAKTNRFESPRVLRPPQDSEHLEQATLEACNRALEQMDAHWVDVHKRLPA